MVIDVGCEFHYQGSIPNECQLTLFSFIKGYNFKENKLKSTQEQFYFYQPYIESMKFAFAQRGVLGDPDFLPDGDIEKVDLKFKVDN